MEVPKQENCLKVPKMSVMGTGAGAARSNRSIGALVESLRLDLVAAWLHLIRNVIGGSHFLPRVVRFVVYRLAGLQFATPDIAAGQRIYNSNIRIGRQTSVSLGCSFEGGGLIEIGEHCMVGPETAFVTSFHSGDGAGGVLRHVSSRPVTVGDRVWIGARCVLLPGAVVGDGCVLAAGSVVTGKCEPGFIYGGVPARRIRPTDSLAPVGQDLAAPE